MPMPFISRPKYNKSTLAKLAVNEMQNIVGGINVKKVPSQTEGSDCDSINTKFTKIQKCC